jgi:hypothetical protein
MHHVKVALFCMAKRRRRTSTTNGLNGWGSAHAVTLLSSLSIFFTQK